MFDSQVLAFALVAGALTITPGADTMLVLRSVLRSGRSAGLATMWGISAGLFVHAALSAIGVSVILARSAALFHAVKLAGAAYLVWLGGKTVWEAWRGRHATGVPSAQPGGVGPATRSGVGRCLLDGFLCNVLNPKVAVFYLAFLPQFIAPGDPVLRKSLLLAAIHGLEGLVWLTAVAFLAAWARHHLLRPAVRRRLESVCGALLVALGLRLALTRD
ncbi:LysE family translocator [bacterium]|nr:LysE family translocator [bacterium]